MILLKSNSFLSLNITSFIKLSSFPNYFYLTILTIAFFFFSCAPTKRFTEKEVNNQTEGETTEEEILNSELSTGNLRVLLDGFIKSNVISIDSPVNLCNLTSKLTSINPGNEINCYVNSGMIRIAIDSQNFDDETFFLIPIEDNGVIKINGKRYKGKIQLSSANNKIEIVNITILEDYVKGVLAKEMPLGKNDENFEALKALSICIRTYAARKMKDDKIYFDLYDDTRDQVYGGVDAENPLSNRAADETKNIILKSDDGLALIYYHSTCGGFTEASENVFTEDPVPYLRSIKDGDDPYCKISPKFQWKEIYECETIIDRLKNYSILENIEYRFEDISIINRFESGRVSELEIKVVNNDENQKSVVLKGNEIRSVLRTADGKNILWSTLFDLSNESNTIVLSGRGYGHGVGLCQWGAIALSRDGWSYEEILNHYYPGTVFGMLND